MSPKPRFHTRTHGLALALFLAFLPAMAVAQECVITGPASICGGPVELCGPEWGPSFQWTLPDGSNAFDPCIMATMPGTYTLEMYDMDTNTWFGPCQHVVTGGAAPASTITGPGEGCAGSTVELCGPAGSLQYEWTGPDGSVSNSACLRVSASGSYQLRVREPEGCWSAPSAKSVAFTSCGKDTGGSRELGMNCPRPATFWARQCHHDHGDAVTLDAQAFAAVAACVDASHDLFSWSDPAAGLCRTVRPEYPDLRSRARKQFAAVAANVCASDANVTSRRYGSVSLDAATAVNLGDVHTTVGGWMAFAEGELARLQTMRQHSHEVRRAYRALISTGWSINHGLGIGPVCAEPRHDPTPGPGGRIADRDMSEPLSVELGAEGNELEVSVEPNPFTSHARVSYAMPQAAQVTLGVYDVSGRLVKELANGTFPAGEHEAMWDGRDASGSRVRGGMYFVIARIGGESTLTRVTMVQ